MSAFSSRSLAFRLAVTSAGWSIVILAIAGYIFSTLFRAAVERSFDERLLLTLDNLLANIEYDSKGTLREITDLGDSRYILPLQGWYWQVASTSNPEQAVIRSRSLLEKRLNFADTGHRTVDENGLSRFYHVGPDGHPLRVIEQKFQLEGSPERVSFIVTGNTDELEKEIASFNQTLWVTLAILAFGLVLVVLIQVRFGLHPLHRLRRGLIDVRNGSADKLYGVFPLELQPLIEELNVLLQSNKEIVERARTQVGNLAHALKTPLSVIRNDAGTLDNDLSKKIVAQADIMTDQISLYLDRARRAARAKTAGTSTPVAPVIESLIRTLEKIHTRQDMPVVLRCNSILRFRGEKQDFEEMIGNLLDNAFKWARHEVRIEVEFEPLDRTSEEGTLTIIVEDDGPGLTAEQREDAVKRGKRLDESKPGSGLGLSIVTETAENYGGTVRLDPSPSGGLGVRLVLPGSRWTT